MVQKYVRTGKAKMEFRPIAFISESSERGALGAEAAAKQDAIWPFVTTLYENQAPRVPAPWLTDDLMEEAVGKLGLDVDQWKSDYMSNEINSAFFERSDQAKADEVEPDADVHHHRPQRHQEADRRGRRRRVRRRDLRGGVIARAAE